MQRAPITHIFPVDNSYFGLAAWVIKIRDESFVKGMTSLNWSQQRAEYQKQICQFLSRIHRSLYIASISIRHIYYPQEKFLQMALLVRANGETAPKATYNIKAACQEIFNAFPHSFYELVSVDHDKLFYSLYQPISTDKPLIVEVRKAEVLLSPKYVAAGEYYYCIEPFGLIEQDLLDALIRLEDLIDPILISTTLEPTDLTLHEESTLNNVIGTLEKFANGFVIPLYSAHTIFEPDILAQKCLERYQQFFDNLDYLFQFRLQLISSAVLDLTTLQALLGTITPLYALEVVNQDFWQDGRQTYTELDTSSIWGGSPVWESEDAPQSLRRLSFLLSHQEAAAILKMPVKFHERKEYYVQKTIHIGRDNQGIINMDSVGELQTGDWHSGDKSPNRDVITFTEAISTLTKAVQASQNLSDQLRAEILEQLEELQQQSAIAQEKRLRPTILRTILDNLAKNLGAVGDLATIWSTWGSAIRAYFNI